MVGRVVKLSEGLLNSWEGGYWMVGRGGMIGYSVGGGGYWMVGRVLKPLGSLRVVGSFFGWKGS